jgi:hypothetical protein
MWIVLGGWLIATVVVGATGMLAQSPVPPPAIAVILTIGALLLLRMSAGARRQVRQLGPAPLVGLHLIRILAGAYFLVLFRRGVLPGEFAIGAGWGDIIVGIGAALVLWKCLPVRTNAQRYGLLAWNAVGLLDILMVLGNGARLFIGDPEIAAPFTTLPLALLPLFVVPLVIASHVLLFAPPFRRETEAADSYRST